MLEAGVDRTEVEPDRPVYRTRRERLFRRMPGMVVMVLYFVGDLFWKEGEVSRFILCRKGARGVGA